MTSTQKNDTSRIIHLFGEPVDTPDGALTVLLVDDQPVFRNVARSMLERDGDFTVVGEATNGQGAVEMVARIEPDVVVMDVQMSDISGIEAARRILSHRPGTNVVLISMGSDSEYPALARAIGARGFLPKRYLNAETLMDVLDGGPTSEPSALAA